MSAFARSYARAVVEVAPKKDDVEKLIEGGEMIARAIASDPRLKEFVAAPSIPRDAKEKALESLGARAGLDEFGQRFLALVLRNRRILHLGEILAAVREELDRSLGVAQAHVRVAAPIAPEEEKRIAGALERSLGKSVRMTVAVDESVLGGFVAKVGSQIIDASVASAITRFQERTKEIAGA